MRTSGTFARIVPVLALLYVVVVWGWSFPFTKSLFQYIDPESFVGWGFIASGLLMALIAMREGRWNLLERWPMGVTLGLLLCGVELPQAIGLDGSSAQNTAFISNAGILLVPFIAYVIAGERLRSRQFFALIICAIGLWYFTGGITALVSGDFWLFLTALVLPIYLVLLGREEKKHPGNLLVSIMQQFLVAGIISVYFAEETWKIFALGAPQMADFLLVTFLATFLPYFFVEWAEGKVHMITATFIFILEPLFGGLFAWTLGNEAATTAKYIGATLIILALIISQLHPRELWSLIKGKPKVHVHRARAR